MSFPKPDLTETEEKLLRWHHGGWEKFLQEGYETLDDAMYVLRDEVKSFTPRDEPLPPEPRWTPGQKKQLEKNWLGEWEWMWIQSEPASVEEAIETLENLHQEEVALNAESNDYDENHHRAGGNDGGDEDYSEDRQRSRGGDEGEEGGFVEEAVESFF